MADYLESVTEAATSAPVYPLDSGVQQLYHYERFHPEYLASLLRDKRIRCSNPSNLNDPWDCRPWFDTKSSTDAITRKEMIAWFLMLDSGVQIDDQDLKNFERAAERNPEILARVTNHVSELVRQMFVTHWRIYCLTPRPCSTLMWSHYADHHRGICLEFATNNELFRCARRVVYLSAYPAWQPHVLMDTRIEEALLTKSDDWQHEEEYRVVARRSNAGGTAGDRVLTSEDGYLNLPINALMSIVVGCEANYELVTAIVKHYAPDLPVKRVVRVPNQYRLEIE